jgi:hypothetical protein
MYDLEELPSEVTVVLRRELLRLAHLEEELAATQAAQVPYWAPLPPSVDGHRAAARALREDADRLLTRAA